MIRKGIYIFCLVFIVWFFIYNVLQYELYDFAKNDKGEIKGWSFETEEYRSRICTCAFEELEAAIPSVRKLA